MEEINFIKGGVCAPEGFKAGGIHCGIRKNKTKKDLALIVSSVPAAAAGMYTTNIVKGAPIYVTKEHLQDGKAQAIICNSGNANTCNFNGIQIAKGMAKLVERESGIDEKDVIVASTGVIGEELSIEPMEKGIHKLYEGLKKDGKDAANAIMTTDTRRKEIAVEFTLGGKKCVMGGMAKGSGMIHPNMATMLVFLTTDLNISPEMLKKALKENVDNTFNMISIDGDTSTNDMVVAMANGLAGNAPVTEEDADFKTFSQVLNKVMVKLSREIARDGEGATKLLTCNVAGAPEKDMARKVAKSTICSTLLKAAMFGADANWGRVLCAIGYSEAPVDTDKLEIAFKSKKGDIPVFREGSGIEFDEDKAKEVLLEDEVIIDIRMNQGSEEATAWGCDLTYDYVKINGEYRT